LVYMFTSYHFQVGVSTSRCRHYIAQLTMFKISHQAYAFPATDTVEE
jgi:hypothetical protein